MILISQSIFQVNNTTSYYYNCTEMTEKEENQKENEPENNDKNNDENNHENDENPSSQINKENEEEKANDDPPKQLQLKAVDFSQLKLDLNGIDSNKYSKNHPLSAPSRMNMKSPKRKENKNKNPLNTARQQRKHESCLDKFEEDGYEFKRIIPYTPRLDELPLSLRLHSNPMILLQSLRRQKVSNYNMYHTEPAIDNKPSKHLREYAKRRKKLREQDIFTPKQPTFDPNDCQLPKFVAKQFKYEVLANNIRKQREHKNRCNNMQPHIDNKLPKNIISYRKMRRERLKNAKKKARKLHEKRLQSPPNTTKPPAAPTRKAPPNIKKRLSQIEKEKMEKQKNNQNKKLEIQATNATEIVYVNEKIARASKFIPSPKKTILSPNEKRRKTLVQALPCHFDEWQ